MTIDHLVVGGGFYGCSLALLLKEPSNNVVLLEERATLLSRASRVNQARVHSGFHYPRSIVTAAKSAHLHRRFAADFPEAIMDNFQMLYAVARRRSKVSAKRFYLTFRSMGAPIKPATPSQAALFNDNTVESVFACTEWAFDYTILRERLAERLLKSGVTVLLGTKATDARTADDGVEVTLSTGETLTASQLYNVTYSQTNHLLKSAGLPGVHLKHELAEIALIEPPEELKGFGITVMDGPFFSTMPYPSENLYSLTHVRYTPHLSWVDGNSQYSPHNLLTQAAPESRHRHMILDGSRYVPCLARAEWRHSLFDIKTVLLKNEFDDGRPILYRRDPGSRITSVLGGKIDNVYDLFDVMRQTTYDTKDEQ